MVQSAHVPGANPDPAIWPTGRLLSMAARMVEHAWNQTLAAADVTHAGMMVLHRLDAGAGSQRDIAKAQGVQEQTIARTLTHLEERGYVSRSVDAADKRRRRVEITDSGRELLLSLAGDGEKLTEQVLTARGQDVTQLRDALAGLVSGLSERRWPEQPD
ncbi:MarR family transcriptional regulator [Nakamurella antarctica]|uniref:MarR family transcriptional regulator n=1 Tax=Nakamurella antarctica TaxID=1902245 RepID=A0A3G8ZP49_9ACTN|nr:MarR family transcriptional regulator [Nakamurella antarctica]AZI59069.1 MarR family transcriptional regulator [Nakamurella antarctica]